MQYIIRNKDNHNEFVKHFNIWGWIIDVHWGNYDECRVFNEIELKQWTNENDRVKDRIKEKCPHAEFIEVYLLKAKIDQTKGE